MTVRLSPHKVRKILIGYFSGLPQIKIADAIGVDQSSISHYATRFKEAVASVGILAAGRSYQVLDEVESLRSLSVELYQSKLTVEDAKQGHNIIKSFYKLGVNPETHTLLIDVCKEVGNPAFIEKAIELVDLERHLGISRDQAVSRFEEIAKQLPGLEAEIGEAKSKLGTINSAILKKKGELANRKEYLKKYQEYVKNEVDQLEKKLSAKMAKFNVHNMDIEVVENLKKELSKQGLDIPTLLKLAKEFSHDKVKG